MLRRLEEMLTLREIAYRLDVPLETAWQLVKDGELVGYRLGGEWNVPLESLQAYLVRQLHREQNGTSVATT